VPKISVENKSRSFAIRARNSYALGVMEPIDIYKILTIENVACIKRPMDTEISGAYFSAEKAKVILINTAKTIGHQNFTAAHELYHALFEDGLETRACTVGRFDIRNERETAADFFATHFLMPEEGIRYYLARRMKNREELELADVIYLEQLYGVSHLAMLKRLVELNIMDNKAKEEFLPNIRNNAIMLGYDDWLYRPSQDSYMISDYAEKVKLAYDKELISFSKYEELLADAGLDPDFDEEEVADFVD